MVDTMTYTGPTAVSNLALGVSANRSVSTLSRGPLRLSRRSVDNR